MAVYSGRYGCVDGVSQVQNWTLERTMTDNAQANSATRAAKTRDLGIFDWTGGFTFVGGTFPNLDDFRLKGHVAPSNGKFGTAGKVFSGSGIINSVSISGDASTGARVQTQVQFGGNGELSETTEALTDTIQPVVLNSRLCKLTFDSKNIAFKSFSLNLTQEAPTYIDSSTEGWTKRLPGILDFTGSFVCIDDSDLLTMGTVGALTIAHNSLSIATIQNVIVTGISGITVDPSSGAIVEYTVNFGLQTHGESGDIGSILLFGTSVWPPTAGITS